ADRRTWKTVAVTPEATPVALTISAAPSYGEADHLWDHAVAVVGHGDEVRLDLSVVARLEPEANRDDVRARLARVVAVLGQRPRGILVAQIAHSAEEGIREHDTEAASLFLLVIHVLTLALDRVDHHDLCLLIVHVVLH